MLRSLTKERLIVRVTFVVLLEITALMWMERQNNVGGSKAGKKVMTFITNRELCCAFHDTQAFSRVSVTRCECHTVVPLSTVNRDPKAAQGTSENGLQRGRWVAAQKLPQQHLARETSLLGVTRSPTSVARAPVISGGSHIRLRNPMKPAHSS